MIEHARYAVRETLGEGAQGRVVRVTDRERPEAKLVAKVLAKGAPVERLAGEFALLSRLRAPGLVRVHDFARDEKGVHFLVEDLVEGEEPKELDVRRAAELAETLAAIHDAGFVHGDVKPSNVRVPKVGRAMLLDLGASVAARSVGPAMLTPAFSAPEVRAGAAPSVASDVYSLGATLRACAVKIAPSVADLFTAMTSEHPADRPRSARDVLAALGRSRVGAWESGARGVHVREAAVQRVLAASHLVYVTGPSGVGKSHVVREAVTRALLAGREVRLVSFPESDARTLVAFLRGGESPFAAAGPVLLVLDDLHAAPTEVVEALDAHRCSGGSLSIVATAREAPPGAETIALEPLDDAGVERLMSELGAPFVRESGGLPGWIVASLGRVPLGRDAALARVAGISVEARRAVALVATMGGVVASRAIANEDGIAEGFASGLLERERELVRLSSPKVASDLAAALADFSISDRCAEIVLADPGLPASVLAAVAHAPCPPEKRTLVLASCAERAREESARSVEIDALLALVSDRGQRTAERLVRLERLTRDAGTARAHPQVLAWLEEDPSLASLAARRRAEERARAGDLARAREVASRALELAANEEEEAYALATKGAVELWAADWPAAAAAFSLSRSRLASAKDREEIARLEHNAGVVLLYRGEHEAAAAALSASVKIKRELGDRAGVRACLLNLGLAWTRAGRFEEAARALAEATALAVALGQTAGRAWCVAAAADLEVRRGAPQVAARLVAEAEALGDDVPPQVRADLALLRAAIALAEGNGRAAQSALGDLPEERDALVDARARVYDARARLATLPADRHGAARAAIAALRRARAAGLADVAQEAISALAEARQRGPMTIPEYPAHDTDLLRALATEDPAKCALLLATFVVREAGAERALLAEIDPKGHVVRAWGADLDGLPLAEAEKRIDVAAALAARRGKLVYQADVSRIAVAGTRSVVIAEHRFTRGAFDRVSEGQAARWAMLADIVLRLGGPPASVEEREAPSTYASSTAVPRREPAREYPEILGRSTALRQALAQLDAAVDTELPVLVQGETGTGKELFARALHDHGARRAGPFVAVNCAAIADALFEAELFGHARGAFTGADRARGGLLARAEGGTLFLDEIGELPLQRQAALLRALEARRYRPVGSDDERAFDVRIVAATNRDLDAAVNGGSFRKDLLFRLRVLEIVVPALRDRSGDVELLVRHFLVRAGSRATLTPSALMTLDGYAFPGNVRELLHVAQRLAATRVDRIEAAHLPRTIRAAQKARAAPEDERSEVETALARTAGNISRAATLLGLTRHGLKKRMLRLGLRAKESAS